MGVRHRLQRCEGFRRVDEESLRRVEVTDSLREVGAINVRHEAERHGAVAVMFEGLVGHHWPEVGAADADVDHVAHALASVALPGTTAHPVAKVCHLIEDGVDLGHYVLAINNDSCSSWRAQGHMQDSAVFRDVDFLAPEHGINTPPESGCIRELQEQLEGLVGDAILRVIEVDTYRFGRHTLAACGIIRKKLAQMELTDILMVSGEGLPCLTFSEGIYCWVHLYFPFIPLWSSTALACLLDLSAAELEVERLRPLVSSCQRRNPPTNAL